MTPGPHGFSALTGCRIVIAADRRSSELQAALERHGATVERAPALTILSHVDDQALLATTRALIAAPPDIVIATTGVGFRGWIEAAHEAGIADDLLAALAGARILARGPKARGAVLQAGLETDWVAGSETAREVGDHLRREDLTGLLIAVQHHGSGSDGLDEQLTAAGADVASLTVYRWGPPEDPDLVARSVRSGAAGAVDAVLFTSAPGASAWLDAAASAGELDRIRELALRGRLLMAAVGPITAGPLEAAGLPCLIAQRGRLGSLVRGVVAHFGDTEGGLPTPRGRLALRSAGAVLGGEFVPLSPATSAMLDALAAAGGSVVPRAALLGALPGSRQSTHAVEMAIARLREALGHPDLVATVVKRGYRLTVSEES